MSLKCDCLIPQYIFIFARGMLFSEGLIFLQAFFLPLFHAKTMFVPGRSCGVRREDKTLEKLDASISLDQFGCSFVEDEESFKKMVWDSKFCKLTFCQILNTVH